MPKDRILAPEEWADWPDERLLDLRMCQLGVAIETSVLAERIAALQQELEGHGLGAFRPHFWLSDEWFSPDGVPGVAIPFYLAHPRLERLERTFMLEVEGGTPEWCMRILRHEAGHAVDNAYKLRQRRRRQQVFGPSYKAYPQFYDPRPYSKSFVLHLDSWYAQSHPDEDFAETFAVWLSLPEWRDRYAEWPALKKLEYLYSLMGELAGKPMLVRTHRRVVNVITKSPREMQGTSAILGVGGFDRNAGSSAGEGAGTMFYVSGTHAQAVNDRLAFKISAGGYTQDPYARPAGQIPCDRPEVCTATTAYPNYVNKGSSQPKFDARVDYDLPDGKHWSFSGGVAGTDGVMHTGIGPFDIDKGSVMGYGKVNFSNKGFKAAFFTNQLNGDAVNLLSVDATTGKPVVFNFATNTIDFEASNVQTFKEMHVVTYGGNLRFNSFDLSLAPNAENRTEGGGYVQDEMFLSKLFRLVVGGRVDRFDYLDNFVFSPRVSFMVKPRESQTFRISYNRAYRSPSVINNFLDVTLAQPINLTPFARVNPAVLQPPGPIYPLPVKSVGNPDLSETTLDAFEIGYTGAVLQGRAIVSAAFYVNHVKNDIFFTEVKSAQYTATNPPPNWAFGLLPPQVIAAVPGGALPALFTYQNFGRTIDKGLELGIEASLKRNVGVFANYSFQAEPDVNFDLSEVNLPAKNRFNAGFNFTQGRFLGNLTVSYAGGAFWQDVLNEPFHGTTDAYTMVSGGVGVKWMNNHLTTSVKATNIGNQEIQQHVFGDIIKRAVVGELRVNF